MPRIESVSAAILAVVFATCPVAGFSASDTSSAIPDLSGVWGRNTIDYSTPDSGKGPLKNISGSRTIMVGDFHDPMLKPWAADAVKLVKLPSRAPLFRPPITSAGPNRRPIFSAIRNCRWCSKNIRCF